MEDLTTDWGSSVAFHSKGQAGWLACYHPIRKDWCIISSGFPPEKRMLLCAGVMAVLVLWLLLLLGGMDCLLPSVLATSLNGYSVMATNLSAGKGAEMGWGAVLATYPNTDLLDLSHCIEPLLFWT
jgi:hypothetical protein